MTHRAARRLPVHRLRAWRRKVAGRLNCIPPGDWLAILLILAPVIVFGLILAFAR